jgi:hypothetical protein
VNSVGGQAPTDEHFASRSNFLQKGSRRVLTSYLRGPSNVVYINVVYSNVVYANVV